MKHGEFGKKVKRSVLDIECTVGTSQNAAVEVGWSLKKLDDPDPVCFKIIYMFGTDAGGGGGGKLLNKELVIMKHASEESTWFETCGLHGMQLVMVKPIKNICGEGDLGKINLLQYLHNAFTLQQ